MGNFFRQMKMRRSSQYLAVILAVFMLTGAVSGPVCAACVTEADPTAAETWTGPALEKTDVDPAALEVDIDPAALEVDADSAAMEAGADPAVLETGADSADMEAGADPAVIEAGTDSDPEVPEAETDFAATEAAPEPALVDAEADPGLETQAEAGTEDQASEDGQGVFTITYSANGGGYFEDTSWSDGQYINITESVGAGTMICSRNSTDLSGDSFEYPSDYLSETNLSQTGDSEGVVYKIGTVALFADDGNEFLGWSLREDGAEMIPEEGLDVSRDETVFAVWKQDNPDEEVRPDEGAGTEKRQKPEREQNLEWEEKLEREQRLEREQNRKTDWKFRQKPKPEQIFFRKQIQTQ